MEPNNRVSLLHLIRIHHTSASPRERACDFMSAIMMIDQTVQMPNMFRVAYRHWHGLQQCFDSVTGFSLLMTRDLEPFASRWCLTFFPFSLRIAIGSRPLFISRPARWLKVSQTSHCQNLIGPMSINAFPSQTQWWRPVQWLDRIVRSQQCTA